MARGLYGALIVEEDEPPKVDRDEVLLIDDWRLDRNASIAENFGAMMDWSHGGRLGNWITVNGRGDFSLAVRQRTTASASGQYRKCADFSVGA
jgi:FtsP/CotA-like multicopper oxidase with cupredoxin domain